MKNVVIAGAVIILILLGAYFFLGDDTDSMDAETAVENNAADEISGNDTVNTSTQTGTTNSVRLAENETGNFANIASATLDRPGYVVIYKVNSNGNTTLLGSTDLLAAGSHTDMQVQLDTVVAREETIVAVLFADTDGDGEFSEGGDDGYIGNAGTAIISDVDVVDVPQAEEQASLEAQVDAYLESSLNDEEEVASQ